MSAGDSECRLGTEDAGWGRCFRRALAVMSSSSSKDGTDDLGAVPSILEKFRMVPLSSAVGRDN